jgi:hypothetical protein
MQTTAADACLDGLAAYLAGKITNLSIDTEWPDPNRKLVYPHATLFHVKGQSLNTPPTVIAQTTPDEDNLITVTQVTGFLDFKIQIDLWTGTKAERDEYLGKILDAMDYQALHEDSAPSGLSLCLTNYYNEYARFDLDSYEHIDDEAAVQRGERRCKIELLVNTREVKQRTYYAMTTPTVIVDASIASVQEEEEEEEE